jgi:hypothetical protein
LKNVIVVFFGREYEGSDVGAVCADVEAAKKWLSDETIRFLKLGRPVQLAEDFSSATLDGDEYWMKEMPLIGELK